jgi:hypothetical protein
MNWFWRFYFRLVRPLQRVMCENCACKGGT